MPKSCPKPSPRRNRFTSLRAGAMSGTDEENTARGKRIRKVITPLIPKSSSAEPPGLHAGGPRRALGRARNDSQHWSSSRDNGTSRQPVGQLPPQQADEAEQNFSPIDQKITGDHAVYDHLERRSYHRARSRMRSRNGSSLSRSGRRAPNPRPIRPKLPK